jgi:hypothetical protein
MEAMPGSALTLNMMESTLFIGLGKKNERDLRIGQH